MSTAAAELLREGAESMRGRLRLHQAGEFVPAEAAGLLRVYLALAQQAAQLWEAVETRLLQGAVETRSLAETVGEIGRSVEACAGLLQSGIDVLQKTSEGDPLSSEVAGLLQEAETAATGLDGLERRITEVRDWVSRPLAPIDPDRLAAGETAIREGKVVSDAELIASLYADKAR